MATNQEREQFLGRLQSVRAQIEDAARSAGRKAEEITLIGVSKFFPPETALMAAELGLADFGENRVQELLIKVEFLSEAGFKPHWHLIGTLQKNKVRQIIGKTHLIHSVDSLELLQEIGRRSSAASIVTDVLLQVNTAGEDTKHGFEPDAMPAALESAAQVEGVRVRGLMTMAPLFENADDTLPVFSKTRDLFTRLASQMPSSSANSFNVLSMGMSHDFRQAIACGATHVRIGTAIFGPRL